MSRGDEPQPKPSIPDFLWASDDASAVASRPAAEPVHPATSGVVPGEIGLWIFILADMSLFALFFLVFLWEGRKAPELYATGTSSLVQPLGFTNTLILLVSSWLVVLAVHAHRRERQDLVVKQLAGALACAVLFLGVKAAEYTHEVQGGHGPATSIFFTFYFVLTGIHLAHLVIGSVLLSGWMLKARALRPWPVSRRYAEGSAVYWHMVDLLWVVIFSLVYLVHVP